MRIKEEWNFEDAERKQGEILDAVVAGRRSRNEGQVMCQRRDQVWRSDHVI